MRTSDSSPDFSVMIAEMLAACKQRGLSQNFAAEAGVFLGTILGFLRSDGAALPEATIGALMCMQALNELYKQAQWDKVLHFGEPIVNALLILEELPASAREVVVSARHSALGQLSNAARESNRAEEALRFADTALQIAGDDPANRAMALNNRALALHELGRLREADDCYQEGIAILDRLDLGADRASPRLLELRETLEQNLRSLQGELGQALQDVPLYFAKEIADRGPLTDYPGLFLRKTGTGSQRLVYEGLRLMQRGLHHAALEKFLLAREAAVDLPAEMKGIVECNLGSCYEALERPIEAQVAYERAIVIHESDPANWKELAIDLFNLGAMLQMRGDRVECIGYFKRAWDVIRANNEQTIVAVSILRHLALCRIGQGDFRRAKAALERGLCIYEKLRPNVADAEEGHRGTLERYRALIELYLYLAVHEGWVEHGAMLIERGKARFWYESLFELTHELRFSRAWGTFDDLAVVSKGRDGLFVFNFFVGPNATFVFAELDGSLELYRVHFTETELSNLVAQVRREFQAPGPDDAFSERAQLLAERLFRSTAYAMRRATEIVIMPDGPLWALPFDALPMPLDTDHQVPLTDIAPLLVAPSYAVLENLRKSAPATNEKILIVSDPAFGPDLPPLPGTRIEAEHIQKVVGGIHLQGQKATPNTFLDHVESCRLIHLATHAFGELGTSEAFLYFSDGADGKSATVSASEILEREVHASLVFLSACSSSIAKESVGEGLTSLGRAFLRAGARSVVSTQWLVDDDDTAKFVEAFYRHLAKGESVAIALWNAKNDRRKNNTGAQTWAAFQVYGDGDVVPLPNVE